MGQTIRLKGNNARNFIAIGLVDSQGEAALDNCSGPMRVAVERELARREAQKNETAPTEPASDGNDGSE